MKSLSYKSRFFLITAVFLTLIGSLFYALSFLIAIYNLIATPVQRIPFLDFSGLVKFFMYIFAIFLFYFALDGLLRIGFCTRWIILIKHRRNNISLRNLLKEIYHFYHFYIFIDVATLLFFIALFSKNSIFKLHGFAFILFLTIFISNITKLIADCVLFFNNDVKNKLRAPETEAY